MALRLNGSWESTTLTSAKKPPSSSNSATRAAAQLTGTNKRGVNLFNKLVFCSMIFLDRRTKPKILIIGTPRFKMYNRQVLSLEITGCLCAQLR